MTMAARILVVDDNPANLELMLYLLRAFGYDPTSATGAETALAAARAGVDLILTDIRMPDVDGFEFVRRVRATPELRGIVIVAVTALAMVGDRERVLGAGFDGYISKPIDPERFVRQIETYLRPDLHAAR